MLNEDGYKNIIDIVKEYTDIDIDKKFIDDNYEKLSEDFGAADDPEYRKYYPTGDPWWTFENEANSESISDTLPRETLINSLSNILFGMDWPCYGDSQEVYDKFERKFKAYQDQQH